MKANNFGYLYAFLPIIYLWVLLVTPNNKHTETNPFFSLSIKNYDEIPVAINDTFILAAGCDNETVTGNILDNDEYNNDNKVRVCRVTAPQIGILSCGPAGNFIFKNEANFRGELTFVYRLCQDDNPTNYTEASLTILVEDDLDCDKVANFVDIDDDNDGILDIHEGDGAEDFDLDGIPNSMDIDSDNDGITDFVEWQNEGSTIQLLLSDANNDGWDDAFDASTGGEYYEQVDTDLDGMPDFLDLDSDGDNVEDFIEGFDLDNDGIPELISLNSDDDGDGLDNAFDTISYWDSGYNSVGSNSPLPDTNTDGIRDWRDQSNHPLIEDDELFTRGKNELTINPNPVYNSCTVTLPIENAENAQFEAYLLNTEGKLIFKKNLTTTTFELNLEELDQGTFLLIVNYTQGKFTGKIVITH